MNLMLPSMPAVFRAAPVLFALLGGCAVGPDFERPAAPSARGYRVNSPAQTAAPSGEAGGAQHFITDGEVAATWWTLYRAPALDALVNRALSANQDLAATRAALRAAEASLEAERAVLFAPSVDGRFSAVRQRVAGAAFGQPNAPANVFTLYNASVGISYRLDVFGGARRQLEALRAATHAQRFELEAARLTLVGNVVTGAVSEAVLRARLEAQREIRAGLAAQLEIVKRRFDAGAASRAEVLAQQTDLAQSDAALPELEKELERAHDRLALLAGQAPDATDMPEFALAEFTLPTDLPVSVPSRLAAQRPDIRAAEELVHQANAEIGVATAGMFPDLSISGTFGSDATLLSRLLSSGASAWSAGAAVAQPLFHGGQLSARRRAARATREQAMAHYREVVLEAFADVASALRALDADARTLDAQAAASAAADEGLHLAQQQYQAGALSYLLLFNAQRQYQQARDQLAQAEGARFADCAALFQALGGGWWKDPDLRPANADVRNALPATHDR